MWGDCPGRSEEKRAGQNCPTVVGRQQRTVMGPRLDRLPLERVSPSAAYDVRYGATQVTGARHLDHEPTGSLQLANPEHNQAWPSRAKKGKTW